MLGLLILASVFVLHRLIVPAVRQKSERVGQLQESLKRADLLLRHAGEGIYGIDLEGCCTFVNAAAERMLGYTEAVGRYLHGLIHLSHVDGSPHLDTACPIYQALHSGQVRRQENDVFWHKNGEPLDVAYVAAPVLEQRRPIGAVVLFDDISHRLRAEANRQSAEQRLRESEANLAKAQAQAKLGSWVIDYRAIRTSWSGQTYRIHEIPEGTPVTPDLFMSRVHPEDRAQVDAEWQGAQQGKAYDIQYRLVCNGDVKWVREHAEFEFEPDGRLIRGTGTLQDISALKFKEEELLRSRQALRELAAHSERIREIERSRIAREIHDELGQYLTALRMDVAMINIRHAAGNPDLAAQVQAMKETIDSTIKVVRHVATALRPAALDMGLISAVEWLLSTFRERSGVMFKLETSDEELLLDDDRTTAVFRILQESLTNITRHARASEVKVAIALDEGDLCLRVSDDGVGFDARQIRAKKTFGLMGIRERALVFGGESVLDSQPGSGTTLTVRIPLENRPAP